MGKNSGANCTPKGGMGKMMGGMPKGMMGSASGVKKTRKKAK